MLERTLKCKNIIERIKNLLYNYDLSLAWAKSEIKFRESNIKVNSQLPNPKKFNIRRQKEAEIEKLIMVVIE